MEKKEILHVEDDVIVLCMESERGIKPVVVLREINECYKFILETWVDCKVSFNEVTDIENLDKQGKIIVTLQNSVATAHIDYYWKRVASCYYGVFTQ